MCAKFNYVTFTVKKMVTQLLHGNDLGANFLRASKNGGPHTFNKKSYKINHTS